MAHCYRDVLTAASLAMIDRLVADTGNASGRFRNFVVHGQPFIVVLPKEQFEVWARFSARKGGVTGSVVRWSGAYVDEQTDTVRELIKRWTDLRGDVVKQLNIFDSFSGLD